MRRKVTVRLTKAEWFALLLAADNGAGAGDGEVECAIFDTGQKRRTFRNAFQTVNDAIGARFSYRPEDAP